LSDAGSTARTRGAVTRTLDEEILIRNWDESPIRGPYHGHAGRAKKAAGLKRPPR
jgi:hypothetical protein